MNATYLYQQPRELAGRPDDVAGDPVAHFLVVCGFDSAGETFLVRDPSSHAPHGSDGRYGVPAQRLINAILLGIVSYGAVLLEIWPHRGLGWRKPTEPTG